MIDDGSRDETLQTLRELNAADPRFSALSFSRNFGKEIAIAAGLDAARGRAVVVMDADLQHPPEVIPEFVEKWREGYQNIYGRRIGRATDPKLRTMFTRLFYRLIDQFGDVALPEGAGDFRLLDRQAVDALLRMRERARFNKGLFAWIGFKTIGVPFVVERRAFGVSSFNFARLVSFALDGLMSFSSIPLKVWTYVGTGDFRRGLDDGGVVFHKDHDLRRRPAGLRLADGVDRLFLRRATAVARHHRRIYRADFRRGEGTPALSRRRADRRGASNKRLTRAC